MELWVETEKFGVIFVRNHNVRLGKELRIDCRASKHVTRILMYINLFLPPSTTIYSTRVAEVHTRPPRVTTYVEVSSSIVSRRVY